MKTYVFEKNGKYLQKDGGFSGNIQTAKQYKGQFWIELLKILIQLISIFGVGKLKRIK